MQTVVGPVNSGPANAVQVNSTGQIVIPENPEASGSQQLWMVSGSGWRTTAPGLFSCTVKISGGDYSVSFPWEMNFSQDTSHFALPLFMIHTQWPTGTYEYSITGDDGYCVWDVNDTMQVTVLQFEAPA